MAFDQWEWATVEKHKNMAPIQAPFDVDETRHNIFTECRGRVISTPASNTGGPGWNLGSETNSPDSDISWLFSVLQTNSTTAFFNIVSNLSFINHPRIRR
jgi:hypothetical protein